MSIFTPVETIRSVNGIPYGGGGSASISVHSTAHGLVVGNLLIVTGSDTYAKATAATITTSQIVGIVVEATADDYTFTTFGSVVSGLAGLAGGLLYYLNPNSDGGFTVTPSYEEGEIRKPVFVAINNTTAILLSQSGEEYGISTNTEYVTVTQNSHGFTVGKAIKSTGNNTYQLASRADAASSKVVGIVSKIISTNTFEYTPVGAVVTNLVAPVVAGTTYYLDNSGNYSNSPTYVEGDIVKPLFVAINTNTCVMLNEIGTVYTEIDTGSNTARKVTQNAHGFSVGDILRVVGNDVYAKASHTTENNAEIAGVITQVIDGNNFVYATVGNIISGVSGLTAGTVYFLDSDAPSGYSANPNLSVGEVLKPVFLAINTTTALLLTYAGQIESTDTFGTIAYQDANAVDITGGSIVGLTNLGTNLICLTPRTAPDHIEGCIYYDSTDKTPTAMTDINGFLLNIGQENVIRIVNKTGGTLSDGTAVYLNGAQGNRPTIEPADADIAAQAERLVGVVTHDIDDNLEGFTTVFGIVRNYNTSGFTAGDVLWLSQTAGLITNVKPPKGSHAVRIGFALNSTVNGSIFVHPEYGTDLTDLHDVSITAPANLDVLYYDDATGLWKNYALFTTNNNWSGVQSITNTTDCTTSYTGALQVLGGAWFDKSIGIGGNIVQGPSGVGQPSVSPRHISQGGQYIAHSGPTAKEHVKMRVYEDTSGTVYGFTVSYDGITPRLEYTANTSSVGDSPDAEHVFFTGKNQNKLFTINKGFVKVLDGNYVYLRGDATTNGSVRVSSQESGVEIKEIRKSGAWIIVDSTDGCYAEIHLHDGATAQTIPNGVTYTKTTLFTDNGIASNCTPDVTNDKITITRPGRYRITGSFSFTCNTNNVVWRCSAFVGGVESDNVHWERKVGTGSDIGSASFSGFVDIPANTDVDVRVAHDQGASVDLTLVYANLNVEYIGNE